MARRRPAEPTTNPARGAALVVVAVVIGLFLLRNGLDTSEAITNQGGGDTSSDGASDGSTDSGSEETTTTAAPVVRPPAEVPTIVLNDSGVDGAAGRYTALLVSLGYQLTDADGATADVEGDAAATQVYFVVGFEAEAQAVAVAIGAPTLVPVALPTVPPGQIAGASVVVVLGTDLASVTPTTGAPVT